MRDEWRERHEELEAGDYGDNNGDDNGDNNETTNDPANDPADGAAATGAAMDTYNGPVGDDWEDDNQVEVVVDKAELGFARMMNALESFHQQDNDPMSDYRQDIAHSTHVLTETLEHTADWHARRREEAEYAETLNSVTDSAVREILQVALDNRQQAAAERHEAVAEKEGTMPAESYNRLAFQTIHITEALQGNADLPSGDASIVSFGRGLNSHTSYLQAVKELQELVAPERSDPQVQESHPDWGMIDLMEAAEAAEGKPSTLMGLLEKVTGTEEGPSLTDEQKEKVAELLAYLNDNFNVYDEANRLGNQAWKHLIPRAEFRNSTTLDYNPDQDPEQAAYPFSLQALEYQKQMALPEFRDEVALAHHRGRLTDAEFQVMEQTCRVLENVTDNLIDHLEGVATGNEPDPEHGAELVAGYLAVIKNLEMLVQGRSDCDLQAGGTDVLQWIADQADKEDDAVYGKQGAQYRREMQERVLRALAV